MGPMQVFSIAAWPDSEDAFFKGNYIHLYPKPDDAKQVGKTQFRRATKIVDNFI
jgi:hypothetical protein